MIGSVAKYFGWTDDYVKNEISYQNLCMYLMTIPQYDEDEKIKAPDEKLPPTIRDFMQFVD